MWKSNVPILIFGNIPWGYKAAPTKVFPVINAVTSTPTPPEQATFHRQGTVQPPQDCSHVKMQQHHQDLRVPQDTILLASLRLSP